MIKSKRRVHSFIDATTICGIDVRMVPKANLSQDWTLVTCEFCQEKMAKLFQAVSQKLST